MSANPNGQYKPRVERAREVAELKRQGYLHREIAEMLGISRSYASALICDPDGSKERDRRENYRKPCPICGELMTGSEGTGENAPKHCVRCNSTATKYWTRDRIIVAIQLFAERNGRPPVATEWLQPVSVRGADYPPASAVYRYNTGARGGKKNRSGVSNPFESWADAVETAGFPRPQRGQYTRRERSKMPQLTRDYMVFRVNGENDYEILGISNQATNDDAIAALATEEGDYASIAMPNLTRRSVRKQLAVVRSDNGHLERSERTRIS